MNRTRRGKGLDNNLRALPGPAGLVEAAWLADRMAQAAENSPAKREKTGLLRVKQCASAYARNLCVNHIPALAALGLASGFAILTYHERGQRRKKPCRFS